MLAVLSFFNSKGKHEKNKPLENEWHNLNCSLSVPKWKVSMPKQHRHGGTVYPVPTHGFSRLLFVSRRRILSEGTSGWFQNPTVFHDLRSLISVQQFQHRLGLTYCNLGSRNPETQNCSRFSAPQIFIRRFLIVLIHDIPSTKRHDRHHLGVIKYLVYINCHAGSGLSHPSMAMRRRVPYTTNITGPLYSISTAIDRGGDRGGNTEIILVDHQRRS